ncbi:MAG TPA: DUF1667 domain-containing protein [Syntrophorhabdaceae bacterium]|nr:DUF1667 domain-containing protein [Syntrophorhabdaceae bacterium]
MKQKNSKKRKTGKTDINLKQRARRYTCIICPNCCQLETDGVDVVGAGCEKGEVFARQEWTEPLRVLTSTVRCETAEGERIIPFKTVSPVPLSRALAIIKEIRSLHFPEVPPIGTRVDVKNLEKPVEIIITGE